MRTGPGLLGGGGGRSHWVSRRGALCVSQRRSIVSSCLLEVTPTESLGGSGWADGACGGELRSQVPSGQLLSGRRAPQKRLAKVGRDLGCLVGKLQNRVREGYFLPASGVASGAATNRRLPRPGLRNAHQPEGGCRAPRWGTVQTSNKHRCRFQDSWAQNTAGGGGRMSVPSTLPMDLLVDSDRMRMTCVAFPRAEGSCRGRV